MTELLAKRVKHQRIIWRRYRPTDDCIRGTESKTVDSVEYWTQDMSKSWDEMEPRCGHWGLKYR